MTTYSEAKNKKKNDDCDFCNELNGLDCYFLKLYKQQMKDRIILKSGNFAVLPTIGQITEGHVLILPFKHYTSIGGLPRAQISELDTLMNEIRKRIVSRYGVNPVFFEHGTVCEGKESGGCGIYHMHLHTVPLSNQIDFLKFVDLPLRKIRSLFELRRIISKGRSYVLYVDQLNNMFVSEKEHLQSQYMRQKLAVALGLGNWDWRQSQKEERLILTYKRLLQTIA